MDCKELTNNRSKRIEQLWRLLFPDALILPIIGYPETRGNGVMTLTHTANTKHLKMHNMVINGLKSNSPLANNALYSVEIRDGRFINLYEIMLPDIPGEGGSRSTVQFYIDTLQDLGIHVSASHYHWTGSKQPFMLAIHSYSTTMSPEKFTERTLYALERALLLIKKRMCK
jgi:hypothetical protein